MERRELAGTVEAAQAGDTDALGRLVEEFARTVLGAAYGWCGDWDRAQDIAQEAFAIAIERLGELREPAAFPGWMHALVRTAAGRSRRTRGGIDLDEGEIGASLPGPEEEAATRDEAARLRSAVEALPPALRLPVVLHYFAGLAVADVADLCGVPVSTVKKRMRDARERLRKAVDATSDGMLERLALPDDGRVTEEIRLYAAVRMGDVPRVRRLLEARPDLVEARERWTHDESFAHRLPLLGKGTGTPLLRAIERDDLEMARLLLDHGADPGRRCACPTGEPPLWAAVVHRRVGIARELLARGADPGAAAFSGTTPLHVAAMRGYEELVDLLRAHGAAPERRDGSGRTPRDWAADAHPRLLERLDPAEGPVFETGIKALDLWCPLPRKGLARWTAGPFVGSTVLLGELAFRVTSAGRPVVFTGFTPSPTDLGDWRHGLAELGVADRVALHLASHRAPIAAQCRALDEGIAALRAALDGSDAGGLLVVFEEIGRSSEIELRVPELAALGCTTLVVAPIRAEGLPPRPGAGAYQASVAFDPARARAQRWPAVGPEGSWSRLLDSEGAQLMARARALLRAGGPAADALDAYLAQPFFTAAPFSGVPGESVPMPALRAAVRARLAAHDAEGPRPGRCEVP